MLHMLVNKFIMGGASKTVFEDKNKMVRRFEMCEDVCCLHNKAGQYAADVEILLSKSRVVAKWLIN